VATTELPATDLLAVQAVRGVLCAAAMHGSDAVRHHRSALPCLKNTVKCSFGLFRKDKLLSVTLKERLDV
jgi:hypothetical protein